MELRQLEYLVAVAEEANFTRAAARVHISQSGVSAQIRQLERELGAELFDRSGRTVSLTPAGRAALDHARAALAAASAVEGAVGEVAGLLRGRVAVGMVVGCTVRPLFDAVAGFHRAHPGVELSIEEGTSDLMVEAVRSGELDLALVGLADAPPPDLDALVVVRERLVALVDAGHRWAGRRRLRLADLAGERLVSMPPGTGVRTALDRSAHAAGVGLTVAVEAAAAEAVIDLAGRGLGVGVLSASMAADDGRVVAVALGDAEVPALLAVVWRARSAPATAELVRRVRDAFGPDGSGV